MLWEDIIPDQHMFIVFYQVYLVSCNWGLSLTANGQLQIVFWGQLLEVTEAQFVHCRNWGLRFGLTVSNNIHPQRPQGLRAKAHKTVSFS